MNDADLDFFVDLEDMRNNYNALVTEFERRNWKKAREFGVFGKPLWEFAFVHRVSDLKVDLFSFTHSKTKGLYYSGLTVEHKSYPCKEYVRPIGEKTAQKAKSHTIQKTRSASAGRSTTRTLGQRAASTWRSSRWRKPVA